MTTNKGNANALRSQHLPPSYGIRAMMAAATAVVTITVMLVSGLPAAHPAADATALVA